MESSIIYQSREVVDVEDNFITLPAHIRDSYARRTGKNNGSLYGVLDNADVFPFIHLSEEPHPLFESIRYHLNESGELYLPEDLFEEIEVEEKAMVIGVVDHFEIWNPDSFRRYERKIA